MSAVGGPQMTERLALTSLSSSLLPIRGSALVVSSSPIVILVSAIPRRALIFASCPQTTPGLEFPARVRLVELVLRRRGMVEGGAMLLASLVMRSAVALIAALLVRVNAASLTPTLMLLASLHELKPFSVFHRRSILKV